MVRHVQFLKEYEFSIVQLPLLRYEESLNFRTHLNLFQFFQETIPFIPFALSHLRFSLNCPLVAILFSLTSAPTGRTKPVFYGFSNKTNS